MGDKHHSTAARILEFTSIINEVEPDWKERGYLSSTTIKTIMERTNLTSTRVYKILKDTEYKTLTQLHGKSRAVKAKEYERYLIRFLGEGANLEDYKINGNKVIPGSIIMELADELNIKPCTIEAALRSELNYRCTNAIHYAKKGKKPENDYEVIVNISNKEEMKLNKEINGLVNGKKLKVTGYYDSKTNRQDYLVNNNTVKYNLITKNNEFMIYPKNKEEAKALLSNDYGLNVIDVYEKNKDDYIKSKQKSIKNSIIFASIILAISVIEIYLMMRSSFLSRIKEVGILRAIGVKRSDIKRMFLGEIFAITTVSSMPRNYFNDIYFETNCENKICK